MASALRPGRLSAGGHRVPAHASGSRDPLSPHGLDPDRDPGRLARLRAVRGVVRAGPRSRLRGCVRNRGLRLRACDGPPDRVARTKDDSLRRSRGRGEAEAAARPRLLRRADRPVTRTGARILVDQLVAHGVDTAFCVPGESYIAVLDALRDAPIRLVVARHEAGAANMAEAYGKLTGRPGVCFVTRAPGATHAATGVYTAFQDSTPLVLFVGQVPLAHRGREAFQELDYGAAFGAYAKLACEAREAVAFPELTARAFATAASGRPGPVVVALPEDVLSAEADVEDARPAVPAGTVPPDRQMT